MKKISLLLLLFFMNVTNAQNLKDYRTLLQKGENSEVAAKMLIEKSSSAFNETKEPIYAGFLAVGKFFMAKHVFNPLKKMSYFNEGKKTMDAAVKSDPKNLEVRLMRLITQESVPKLLGYYQNIEEDRTFLTRNYKNSADKDLKTYIKAYLKL
ncbi:hypothetical protein SAMN05421638_0320 [Kaistella treverensis]|uniref:Uncharacterized protein n=1 Tax=Kaistella treverensis TaxID=631455 RepID=A0A1I3JQ77_9FLAO|nr:hypothetical protein [Kaistella treverensis]SFI62383.1 hypothetical protein SAMN05421638_0320 [Kaistella treverensis]